MISLTFFETVQVDLAYADTSNTDITITGSSVDYEGEVEQDMDIEIERDASDIVYQLCEEEAIELIDALIAAWPEHVGNAGKQDVDTVYESMSEGQRAHMFNKLLKHEDYNARTVSLAKVGTLLQTIDAMGRDVDFS